MGAGRRGDVRLCRLVGGSIEDANLTGLHINNCNIARMRIDGILVEDMIAAYRKGA